MIAFARTRRHAEVLAGIAAAQAAGFEAIKLNSVVIRGYNDDELVDAARVRPGGAGSELRFIEYMDVGGANGWRMDQVVSRREILERLAAHYGPSRRCRERTQPGAGRSVPAAGRDHVRRSSPRRPSPSAGLRPGPPHRGWALPALPLRRPGPRPAAGAAERGHRRGNRRADPGGLGGRTDRGAEQRAAARSEVRSISCRPCGPIRTRKCTPAAAESDPTRPTWSSHGPPRRADRTPDSTQHRATSPGSVSRRIRRCT